MRLVKTQTKEILVTEYKDGDRVYKIGDGIYYTGHIYEITGIELYYNLTEPKTIARKVGLVVKKVVYE